MTSEGPRVQKKLLKLIIYLLHSVISLFFCVLSFTASSDNCKSCCNKNQLDNLSVSAKNGNKGSFS